jgi:hypothetical protein
MPGQGPYDPGEADPMQQAVWSAFPGTDPNAIHELVSPTMGADGGQGLPQVLAAVEQLQGQDVQKLKAMHDEQLNAIIAQLMSPGGPGMQQPAEPVPSMGGEGLGY